MKVDKILTEEIKRFNEIGGYVNNLDEIALGFAAAKPWGETELGEQEGDAPEEDIDLDVSVEGGEDTESDLEMSPVESPGGDEGGDEGLDMDMDLEGGDEEMETETTDDSGGTEEVDVTDIVDTAKEASDKAGKASEGIDKQSGKIDSLLSKLDNLESKLGDMDQVMANIEALEGKIESLRPPTQKERLEMRSLDSGPFNQTPDDFFAEKKPEMEKSGKNEYVLTQEDVENYNDAEIQASLDGPDKEETNENDDAYERKLKVFR